MKTTEAEVRTRFDFYAGIFGVEWVRKHVRTYNPLLWHVERYEEIAAVMSSYLSCSEESCTVKGILTLQGKYLGMKGETLTAKIDLCIQCGIRKEDVGQLLCSGTSLLFLSQGSIQAAFDAAKSKNIPLTPSRLVRVFNEELSKTARRRAANRVAGKNRP